MAEIYREEVAGRAPRSTERKEGRCVGDPARREPCAWEPVLGNLRGGPSVGDGGPVPKR